MCTRDIEKVTAKARKPVSGGASPPDRLFTSAKDLEENYKA
jgi:hypothetical protein